jgi:holo-[acyl-carrier protein] synthase
VILPQGLPSEYDATPGPATPGGVVAVGVDIVAVDRFAAALARTPALAARLLTPAEQVTASGHRRSAASLAARFAAKEAVAKALGAPRGLEWHHRVV